MEKIYRFTELWDGNIFIDDLVENTLGTRYIEIKAKTQEKAAIKFKKDHPIIKSYTIKLWKTMENLTKEDIKYLIIGIRLQLDECDKQDSNYDINIRNIYHDKRKILYDLWKKIEKIGE